MVEAGQSVRLSPPPPLLDRFDYNRGFPQGHRENDVVTIVGSNFKI